MSPNGQTQPKKAAPSDNIYTVILTVAFFVVLATAAFVAYKCYSHYGTIYKIP